MLQLKSGCFLIEEASDLPDLTGVDELFLDVETAAIFEHKKEAGLYPFGGDRICGVAVTADDRPECYYIPVRHTSLGSPNIPLDAFRRWLADTVGSAREWINHNVVFDAVFCHFDGAEFGGRLVDTATLAKTHDSDRFGHGLKQLCRDWLDMEMLEEEYVKSYLKSIKSKSYADVPADKMGEYAMMDVRANRRLYRYLQERRPDPLAGIWDTESRLAAVLYDMEVGGLCTDETELRREKLVGLHRLIFLTQQLADLTGREFTNSSACIYDILINQFGLPVLATKWEKGRDTGRPTFDKNALKLYEVHPQVQADPDLARVIKFIRAYRNESQFQGLFIQPFMELRDADGRIHPTYNPVVRTGRMSCKRPNAQQQNKRSKALIHPAPGRCFISCDYSQIEFRLIAHYCQDDDVIRAYREQPDIDFHTLVAEMLHVTRPAGKTLNFGLAYQMGKRKLIAELSANPDIIAEVSARVAKMDLDPGQRNEMFEQQARDHALRVYAGYHERMPRLKATATECMNVCKRRGYIRNAYGRRRHLPPGFAHKAFNSLIQGCAMDLIKERMVALSPRYNERMRDWGIRIAANVHDEVLFDAPLELMLVDEVHRYLIETLETPAIEFRVPIRTGLGVSARNWAEAAGDDTVRDETGRIVAGKII